MRYVRNFIKKTTQPLGLDVFATELWFKYLGFKNNVKVIFFKDTMQVVRKEKKIIIGRGSNVFGSIGIVVRDFDDFFKTIKTEKNEKGEEIIDFSSPKMHTLIKDNDTFFFHDICEPSTVTDIYVAKANLDTGNVVFDIGAYCGTQTVYFSRLVGETGKVFAFEPDNTTYNSLKTNLDLHKCANTTTEKCGIYNINGEVGFSGDSDMGASVSDLGKYKIKVRTLESVCKEHNIERLDFVKMDIEGSEIEVLNSSFDIINKYKPRFIIEPHFINGVLNDEMIKKIFSELNYKIEILKQGEFDYQPLIYAFPNK